MQSDQPGLQSLVRNPPCAWGYTEDGRYIIAVYDELDELTILPVTAYEVPEPRLERCPMPTPNARRVTRELTPEEHDRLRRQRQQIAAELPDLATRDRMRKEAKEEQTLSGELRRAVHATRNFSFRDRRPSWHRSTGPGRIPHGERTLRSDVLDRLAGVLGYVLQPRA